MESVYVKEQKIKKISNQMISLNTEFEVIDKINPQKITIHSRTNSGIQLKSFNKRKKNIYIYIYIIIKPLHTDNDISQHRILITTLKMKSDDA